MLSWSTLLSGTIGVLLGTLLALWWRRVDAQRADWVTFNAHAQWMQGTPRVTCILGNAGPGTAFRLQVVGSSCDVTMSQPTDPAITAGNAAAQAGARRPALRIGDPTWTAKDTVPAVGSGQEIRLFIVCPAADWDSARIAITWRETSPWRRRHRTREESRPLATVIALPAPPVSTTPRKEQQPPQGP
jgi:hypothetical protein